MDFLAKQDEQVFKAIQLELGRQRSKIELIASENFVSEAVMEAKGPYLRINMQKDIQENGIMAAVNMLIS